MSPYGPISPKLDESTGLPLLKLPDGFRYQSFSWTGDLMSDDVKCPNLHDGMAVVDTKDWSTLAGTVRNCAGGVTSWGTWISGEETFGPGHGWSFEVGPQKGDRRPIVDMGRFSHEAMMVDPATGYVYETEDATPSGFYKFVPNVPGQMHEGGELFMLRVKDQPNFNFGPVSTIGQTWDVQWVPIADPSASVQTTYLQGASAPNFGAQFRRLEGCWWGERTGFFLSTNGGPAGEGQVFEYDPEAETIRLIYVSPGANDLDNPDNI